MTIYQMHIYHNHRKIALIEYRMMIFLMGIVTSLNFFVHYSFLDSLDKSRGFFFIEVCRFTLFFMVCYYFISKASGLLPNKKYILIIIRLVFGVTFIFILTSGVILFNGINNYLDNDFTSYIYKPNQLCVNTIF